MFSNEGFQIYGIIDNKCICVIEGPQKTPFEYGFFIMEIILDGNYPFGSYLKYIFKTKIFHPNITEEGLVSSNMIAEEGGIHHPAMTLMKMILTVQSILDEPDPDNCCLNEIASKLYKENKKKYEETVKEYTSKYANFITFQNQLKDYNLKIEHKEYNKDK